MKCSLARCCRLLLLSASVGFSSSTSLRSPVERVVNLLKDLKDRLTQDEKEEQQAYDKYACWCEKTTARKAGTIDDANGDMRLLGQDILSLKGRVATLTSEIADLVAQIRDNEAAQAKATTIRQKANAAFMAEQAEMKEAMVALQEAMTVLVAATNPSGSPASLLQSSERAAAAVKRVVDALPSTIALKHGQFAQLDSFLQGGSSSQYMPQSFTVQGILVDMYKNFASDLETATLDEATANRNYEAYIDQKQTELQLAQAQKADKEKQKADNEGKLADTQQIYDDTFAQKNADVAFFDQTKQACLSKHGEWTTRSSLRDEELRGINQALDLLTTDDVRELFASAIKEGKETHADDSYNTGRDITSFLQVSDSNADGEQSPPAHAYAILKKQATATHSLRLASMAVQLREAKVGHFGKVLFSIGEMIKTLKQEGLDDIAKRDQCKDEYQNIESKVNNVTWLIQKNVAKIDRLESLIQLRTEQKLKTIEEINDVDAMTAGLTQTRTAENTAFANAKAADQQAIDLLMSARSALASYFTNHSIDMGPIQGSVKALALAQQPEFAVSADQAPDTVFSGEGHRKNEAKGILQILTSIIEDLDDEVKNSMKAEEEAQLEYEAQMASAKKLREELVAKKVSLETAISTRGGEKLAEEEDKSSNEGDLQSEKDYKVSITNNCDFIIRTFEKRAASRAAEMQGLEGAKEYLAKYVASQGEAALLEKKPALRGPTFDDTALANTRFLGLR